MYDLTRITFTGVDSETDLYEVPTNVEIGILYSATSIKNRYPSRKKIYEILRFLKRRKSNELSLHICGSPARQELINYSIPDLTHNVSRIQVNGKINRDEINKICRIYRDHEIITQIYDTSCNYDSVASNHSFLVDGSGGKGVKPKNWEKPFCDDRIGYAGGIDETTIRNVINKISDIDDSGDWWLDMETSLRDENDLFSCEKAMNIIEEIVS